MNLQEISHFQKPLTLFFRSFIGVNSHLTFKIIELQSFSIFKGRKKLLINIGKNKSRPWNRSIFVRLITITDFTDIKESTLKARYLINDGIKA